MTSFRQIEANRRNARLAPDLRPSRVRGSRGETLSVTDSQPKRSSMPWRMPTTMPPSRWPSHPITMPEPPSKENSFFDWQACCGGCAALLQLRVACSRSRLSTYCNFDENDKLIKSVKRSSITCFAPQFFLRRTSGGMKMNAPPFQATTRHQLLIIPIHRTT
jgi:hypothetical protein